MDTHIAYVVTERDGRKLWSRIGTANVVDKVVTMHLVAMPLTGEIQLRPVALEVSE